MKAQQRFKVLIVGETNVGKTSIVSRFIKGEVSESMNNTIGIDFVSTTIDVNDTSVRMQIWDTAGQERYRSITKAYYRGAQGVFIVFDLSNKKSFTTINKWIQSLDAETDMQTPKLLIGNKSDILDESELLEAQNLYSAKSKELGMPFIAVSAFSGLNIEKMFLEMGRMLLKLQKNKSKHEEMLSFKEGRKRACC